MVTPVVEPTAITPVAPLAEVGVFQRQACTYSFHSSNLRQIIDLVWAISIS